MEQDDVRQRYTWAQQIAEEAGRLTLNYFRGNLQVDRKADDSPVTVADREAERLLRQRIEEAFPEDGIVGEEFPERVGKGRFRWILDPIDGTKSFVAGVPLYTTLVAVQQDQRSVAGVIEAPALGESVAAMLGEGTWYRERGGSPVRAQVSGCARLEDAIFVTSERQTFDERGAGDVYGALEAACWVTRTWGDAYGYLLVATGRVDVMVDPVVSLWDAAALQPVIEEAGGRFSNWQGRPSVDSGDALGCNPALWEAVLAHTRAAPGRPA